MYSACVYQAPASGHGWASLYGDVTRLRRRRIVVAAAALSDWTKCGFPINNHNNFASASIHACLGTALVPSPFCLQAPSSSAHMDVFETSLLHLFTANIPAALQT